MASWSGPVGTMRSFKVRETGADRICVFLLSEGLVQSTVRPIDSKARGHCGLRSFAGSLLTLPTEPRAELRVPAIPCFPQNAILGLLGNPLLTRKTAHKTYE